MIKIFIVLFGLLVSASSLAEYENLKQMVSNCEKKNDPKVSEMTSEISCLSYIGGIIDASQVIFSVRPGSRLFCLPTGGVTPEQALSAAKKWAKAYPVKSKESSGRMAVIIGLAQSYPCQ